MPRGDKTGPDGKGSKTGRGLGSCDGIKKMPKKLDNKSNTRKMGQKRDNK